MRGRWPRRWGAVAALGLALWLVHVVHVSRVQWRVLDLELPVATGGIASGRLVPGLEGLHEIEIQVPLDSPRSVLASLILATETDSALPLRWAVTGEQGPVAAGDARSYLYVDTGPGTRLGPVRRALLRVPAGQDAERLRSFGMRGELTASRGVGAFDAEPGRAYELTVELAEAVPALPAGRTRAVVRVSRREWDRRYRRTAWVAYTGLLALAAGLAGLAATTLLGVARKGRR